MVSGELQPVADCYYENLQTTKPSARIIKNDLLSMGKVNLKHPVGFGAVRLSFESELEQTSDEELSFKLWVLVKTTIWGHNHVDLHREALEPCSSRISITEVN